MGEKIVVGPINRGLRSDVTPFNIDNDSFYALINAFQWRGRAKRKRGTAPLTRLKRFFESTSASYNSGSTTITLNASGEGNLITGFSLQTNASIVPGSVTITAPGPTIYTDPAMDGTLSPSGSINYASGDIVIAAEANNAVSASFNYYPALPVMGLEDLILDATQFPGCIGFDTTYSYNLLTAFPYPNYDVSFYKNPTSLNLPSTITTNYAPKTVWTPTSWNGQDYQQFWTVNYQGSLWATNGISIPFSTTNIGMQFKSITNIAITNLGNGTNVPAQVVITIPLHGLSIGDFVFINEVNPAVVGNINFQTGYVIAPAIDANNVNVEFPGAVLTGAGGATTGIAQYLTNRSDITKDCIRWYDGDPTDGNPMAPVLSGTKGWVNFAPPLSQFSFSIADRPARQYYLVGARMIVTFKDRLLFLGPVIQTSAGNDQLYLQDTVIYSQNGTPYYTATFSGDPTLSTTTFNAILVPINETATPNAYWGDQTGFGGFVTAGIPQPLLTVSANEDVLILGFSGVQTRFVYTGNDIVPFNFFLINSELGSASTFSSINMDKGVITRGSRGFIITSQVGAQRIDLEIPDEVFEIKLTDNGNERFTSQRDYINEWIYFTYPNNLWTSKFPNQTLQYNYRDNSWGVFYETYTTYGLFRKQTGFTWQTVGFVYPSWNAWNDPWNAGTSTLLKPEVIAGNQQGFVITRADGTDEAKSLYIKSFSGNTLTVPNHALNDEDFIVISGCLGTISAQVNEKIFSVFNVTTDTFMLDPPIAAGTYLGEGLIKRIYTPLIQSKEFPVSWGMGRKTRIGVQQYLLTRTPAGQIQLLIFLSQNNESPYNKGPITPFVSPNNSLIYDTVLFTCPESTNLGLTPANINLNMVTGSSQDQIWHRVNTSLIGDTVQLGFTLSEEQLRSLDQIGVAFAITGATQATSCVLTCSGQFAANQLIKITGVLGMVQLNEKVYRVISSTATEVTIDVDSTAFTAYSSGGSAIRVAPLKQFAEIELHGFILDVSPSQLLA